MQAIDLLGKARNLGITPNTIMYNTAMSSLGKSGQWEAAEKLFMETSEPDAVTHETLIAAYGMAGQASKAEMAFKTMLEARHTPRDYAYCGLIAAHRLANFSCSIDPVIHDTCQRCVFHRKSCAGMLSVFSVQQIFPASCHLCIRLLTRMVELAAAYLLSWLLHIMPA